MSGSSRVSIPSSVRRTIQNIKEIAGSHSDEEIYAMLKECSMDPDETAHKLLLQARPDKEIREKFYGELAMKASNNNSDKGGFADKNFSDADDASEGTDKSSSDNSVAENQVGVTFLLSCKDLYCLPKLCPMKKVDPERIGQAITIQYVQSATTTRSVIKTL